MDESLYHNYSACISGWSAWIFHLYLFQVLVQSSPVSRAAGVFDVVRPWSTSQITNLLLSVPARQRGKFSLAVVHKFHKLWLLRHLISVLQIKAARLSIRFLMNFCTIPISSRTSPSCREITISKYRKLFGGFNRAMPNGSHCSFPKACCFLPAVSPI